MRGLTATVLGFLGLMLLRARDRLEGRPSALNETEARRRFAEALRAVRAANAAYSEEEVARDVEVALREVREARRAASGS